MRVTLFYNDAAGRSDTLSSLRSDLSRAGHIIAQTVHVGDEPIPPLAPDSELAVAAGGDGTVSGVAKIVSGTATPMAILPMGTANNIATSLGITGTPAALADRWSRGHAVGFDVGIVDFTGGRHVFFEGVGAGIVPAVIHSMDAPDTGETPAAMLAQALRRYQEILPRVEARPWHITVDGQVIEDEFLVVEVLNTPLVGPNLAFSADASPTDGYLAVALVRAGERALLQSYLATAHDAHRDVPFQVFAAKTVELVGSDALHIDDRVHEMPVDGNVSLSLDEAAVRILV